MGCIDNAIHTFSGVKLRLECAEMMEKQNSNEKTGKAKITNAYNLPSKIRRYLFQKIWLKYSII
jgi:O-acetyl-ADP-ribose deacetylase (regulator of RNase III)